jgi:hypothetical protein
MCKVGIVDFTVCGECGGGMHSGVKGRGRRVGEDEEWKREWKKRAEKIFGRKKGKSDREG